MNQQQLTAELERVGINRPDIQGTSPTNLRVAIEIESATSGRGPIHLARILANDPNALVLVIKLGR